MNDFWFEGKLYLFFSEEKEQMYYFFPNKNFFWPFLAQKKTYFGIFSNFFPPSTIEEFLVVWQRTASRHVQVWNTF